MNVFSETKTKEEKEIYEDIWVRKFYHENKKERGTLDTLLWIFNYSYNTTIAFLYVIKHYYGQI